MGRNSIMFHDFVRLQALRGSPDPRGSMLSYIGGCGVEGGQGKPTTFSAVGTTRTVMACPLAWATCPAFLTTPLATFRTLECVHYIRWWHFIAFIRDGSAGSWHDPLCQGHQSKQGEACFDVQAVGHCNMPVSPLASNRMMRRIVLENENR